MSWVAYNFAVLRVVPHPYNGEFVPVGIVLHARTEEFLELRTLTDLDVLRERVGDVDVELLARYLDSARAICAGDPASGPVALTPPSERFHWITAPRSDVVQCSAVHEGITHSPELALSELFERYVERTLR
ncbi:MAG TPA: DUF3037 domain-containing protein [Gemmatimonadaceae bacterium]|jgi:hypothetical protein|nr:DUF3037 domain-containing protein [Gemmatimonadaceae bacterium]